MAGKPKDTRRASAERAPVEAVRLPPRDQLPAGISVKSIRVLGTTWYERGARYWFRRAWMAVCFAIAGALEVVIILAIADAAGDGRTGFGFRAVIGGIRVPGSGIRLDGDQLPPGPPC